jgi:hypothetical protein
VQVFGRRHDETDHTLMRRATKKRQGTKSRGYWALPGSERYGDFDVSAELVCGREGDTPSASAAVGGLMDRIGSRGGNPDRRTLPQLSRFGMNVAQGWGFNLSGICDFR